MPERIQRKRTKGWTTPLCSCGCGQPAIYVGCPTKWGNPCYLRGAYIVDENGHGHYCAPGEARGVAVRLYREALVYDRLPYTTDDLAELRGHDLACWCPLEDEHGNRMPCHADVLLELANTSEATSLLSGRRPVPQRFGQPWSGDCTGRLHDPRP